MIPRILTLLFASILAVSAEYRFWTSQDGRKIEAEYVSSDGSGKVTIKRRNGKVFTLEVEKLSQADQEWIQNQAKSERETDEYQNSPYYEHVNGKFAEGERFGMPFRLYGKEKMRRSKQKYPLLIYLHGKGGQVMNGRRLTMLDPFLTDENYSKHPCFIFVPQAPDRLGWRGRTQDIVFKILTDLVDHLPIDTNRLYVTGNSAGGYGTFEFMEREPKMFAAGVPIAGGGRPDLVKPYRKVPLWVFHGAKDNIVRVIRSQRMVEALKKARSPVKYTEYPEGGHSIQTKVYQEAALHDWIFAQSKENQ